jgi:hypothetical protein
MDKDYLLLKRASASRPSGDWSEVIMTCSATALSSAAFSRSHAAPVGSSWMWTLAFWYHEGRSPTHGYAATREAAMAAFAKSWRRE